MRECERADPTNGRDGERWSLGNVVGIGESVGTAEVVIAKPTIGRCLRGRIVYAGASEGSRGGFLWWFGLKSWFGGWVVVWVELVVWFEWAGFWMLVAVGST